MRFYRRLTCLFAALILVCSCGNQKKIAALQGEQVDITLPHEADYLPDNVSSATFRPADTLFVRGEDGEQLMIMKAIKDEQTGEMVATEVLKAAVVTARFRNKAERNGKVDLEFEIRVPKDMLDEKWEMTLVPQMFILEDSVKLEPIVISGKKHRAGQLRGYQRYQDFIDGIVSDSTVFINRSLLERFIERNIPDLYRFRTDSSIVDAQTFESYYGVDEQEAIEHYTRSFSRNINERKKATKAEHFAKYVKAPIISEGLRLDTVWTADNGDFVYDYLQTVKTRPQLRKIDVIVSGDISKQGERIYNIPASDTLTFYISSLSAFTRDIVRYKTKVIYRKAEANTSCYIVFPLGKADIKSDLANNAAEISRIKQTLKYLQANEVFDLDSIVVTANSSPEGAWRRNADLSVRRGRAVAQYFEQYLQHVRDSISIERGFSVDAQGNVQKEKFETIRFVSRSHPENWEDLDAIMESDSRFTEADREAYRKLRSISNEDRREWLMHRESFYKTVRDSIYPILRTVSFDFHLHRKGMVKDTVQTTVIDDVYMSGVQAIKDRDFEKAVELLAPYKDYNSAVAFLAMDRNYNALEILKKEEPTPEVNYMMAILNSRLGNFQEAVECYMTACRQDKIYISRGNLDPEIAVLIKTYGLNKQKD